MCGGGGLSPRCPLLTPSTHAHLPITQRSSPLYEKGSPGGDSVPPECHQHPGHPFPSPRPPSCPTAVPARAGRGSSGSSPTWSQEREGHSPGDRGTDPKAGPGAQAPPRADCPTPLRLGDEGHRHHESHRHPWVSSEQPLGSSGCPLPTVVTVPGFHGAMARLCRCLLILAVLFSPADPRGSGRGDTGTPSGDMGKEGCRGGHAGGFMGAVGHPECSQRVWAGGEGGYGGAHSHHAVKGAPKGDCRGGGQGTGVSAMVGGGDTAQRGTPRTEMGVQQWGAGTAPARAELRALQKQRGPRSGRSRRHPLSSTRWC